MQLVTPAEMSRHYARPELLEKDRTGFLSKVTPRVVDVWRSNCHLELFIDDFEASATHIIYNPRIKVRSLLL